MTNGRAVFDHEVDELAAALASIAPLSVTVGVRRIVSSDVAALFPSERQAIANAVPRRQREFASGRSLLRELSGIAEPILIAPSRAPVMPKGVVASLAHDRDFVVAAAGRSPGLSSVGIDIEPMEPLDLDVGRVILRADETSLDAHLAFTLKEAAYKAWSSGGGRMLEHHDVRLDVSESTFRAEVVADGVALVGRHVLVAGRCIALVVVSRLDNA